MSFIIEIVAHLAGVIVQEVNGFAHFSDGVAEGFTRLAHQDPHQGRHLAFHQHRGALKNGGALLRRSGEPDRRIVDSAGQRLLHFSVAGFADVADDIFRLCRVNHRLHLAFGHRLLQHRQCLPFMQRAVEQGRGEGGQTVLVRQIETGGVAPAAAVEIARQRDFRMRQAGLAFLLRQFFYRADRVGHQLVQRQGIVRDTVDERGIGAVLQQTTHQIRQQRLVGAHRGVDPARPIQFAVGDLAHHLLVQRFAHAVQALELILARVVVLARQLVDSRQSMGVMGGKLRVNQVRHRQQLLRAGEVGDVGVNLAGVYRIAFETFHLRAFNFAIPVGAFHQTDHQATAAAGGEVNQVINDKRTALLVGLNHEANPVPAGQFRLEAQFFQQVEGDLQTVCLFGVNIDADVILARQQGQRFQPRVKLFHHPVILRAAVARVQRGELNGDTRTFINAAAVGGFADGMDRLLIRNHIGLGVSGGQGGFAEHIVGVAEPFFFQLAGVGQRFGDGFPGDELLAHQAHRHIHAFADQRFAALADDAVQGAGEAGLVMGRHQFSGEQQPPGGGVDEQRRAAADVRLPVAVADFVADQRIAGGFIRNTQQGFRQAHQRHPFL